MTLAALHARFLQHCAVEKRLRPMTIKSYRSDFDLFLQFLRRRSKTLSRPGRGQGEGSTARCPHPLSGSRGQEE
jgi:site-specific recombinase XerD